METTYVHKNLLTFLFFRIRYSDWQRVGRPRGRSSNPGTGKIFLYSAASRLVLGPTQPPIHWVPGVFLQAKAAGA
jgi:hypothetical protein